jgi:hypothetical protein
MGARWARFARGWFVAGFSLFVAALSHTDGGGAAPGGLASCCPWRSPASSAWA